ncbi:MAG: tRNA (cytidine(34)-2'-O)-methyltransferase [Phenylobacterium sp.]|uniref:tRNA (cytidine(34)-2'-O)-methyltransferase n=1 Tax=Phenylobacterium sp. TaxID=1871053 RepID=UPI0025EDB5C3|nr:tRNA (cytidine(34)-2'-O)-methyltransferase [Phenylobacterium sp.]MCA3724293.1 tRNA (cytidine(34)-2'-O)-methyltransferase [Phenylobacterium sp.]MCA3727643.1 tRNA (cytidine(34)-2'-O)-methyltransferase [Phenylobacterium sp.]
MLLALFQPDIPQNLGAAIRLGACLDTPVHVIEPCGFPLSDKAIRRAALDYGGPGEVVRHPDWSAFRAAARGRIVLFTTRGASPLHDFAFAPDDVLLFGRESSGVPDFVHAAADARVIIPLSRGRRSFNLTVSAAIGLSEALRQTGRFPAFHPQDFPSHD